MFIPHETAKEEVLCCVERCGVIFRYTPDLIESGRKLILECCFRVLFDIQSAAVGRSIF